MINAKIEYLEHTKGLNVIAAEITFLGHNWDDNVDKYLYYEKDKYDEFMIFLDREYNNGYGGQELEATIWYDDGNWSNRGEYDGSEWYIYNKCPELPIEVKRDIKLEDILK